MFEETVLRFADKDRQRDLAEREQELAARQANLLARQQNLAFRQGLLGKDPQAVLNAIETEDTHRATGKAQRLQANELKSRFGLKEHELVDTPAMRSALETALAEREVEQAQRAERIADRASLLEGLNRLALIDAQKASAILQANKEINPPREWTRQETSRMFANAMSWKTPEGVTKTYPKTLDGWAKSLQERTRALELAEIRLDAQEQALRAQVSRVINEREQVAAKAAEQATPVAEKTTDKSADKVVERAAEVAAGVTVATAAASQNSVQPTGKAGATNQRTPMDLSYERLKDPKRFSEAVLEYVGRTNSTFAVAEMTVGSVRDRLERKAQREGQREPVADKAEVERARAGFLARAGTGKATSAEVGTPATGSPRERSAGRSNVVDIDAAKRAPDQVVAADVRKTPNAAEVAATAGSAKDAPAGFKVLGRNRTKDVAVRSAAVVDRMTEAGGAQQRDTPTPSRTDAGRRKRFAELNAHEKIERRAEFFGDLRQAAGFTRDGKEAVSEKAREAVRPGKQREGHGIA